MDFKVPVIELKDIYKIYQMGDSEVRAADGINLTIYEEEMAAIKALDKNNRLIKGHVFLWEGAKDWHDLWDEDGVIVK